MCISRSPTDFIQINSIASNASHRNEVQRWKSLQQMPISEQRKEFNKTATAHKTRALHMVNSVRSTRATDISCNCVKCIKLFYFKQFISKCKTYCSIAVYQWHGANRTLCASIFKCIISFCFHINDEIRNYAMTHRPHAKKINYHTLLRDGHHSHLWHVIVVEFSCQPIFMKCSNLINGSRFSLYKEQSFEFEYETG